jgi:hypothetical protein
MVRKTFLANRFVGDFARGSKTSQRNGGLSELIDESDLTDRLGWG